MKRIVTMLLMAAAFVAGNAQDKLYADEFPLGDVTITGGVLKKARDLNIKTLLQYDCDRLLAPYLKEAMDELAARTDFTFDGSDGEYGFFIESVNGLKAVYEEDNAYWAIYVNGEYGQYGADQQPVTDGDVYRLAYEISSW